MIVLASIKKNIFYNISLSILNVLFPIVTIPYISRVLGVSNVGLVNFMTSYVEYFILFAALGVNFYGIREIAKYKDDKEKTSKIFSEILSINIIATIVVTICYFISIFCISSLKEHWRIFILAGLTLYFTPISIDWYFRGLEQFKAITFRSCIIKCLSMVGLFIFVKHQEDVIAYIVLHSFASIGAYIWNLMYAKKKGLIISFLNINLKIHIQPMFIFFASNVAISIFTMLNTLMLGFLSSYEQVGFFSSPNKILSVIISFFGAINIALIPRLAFNRQHDNNRINDRLLQNIFDLHSFLIIPAAIGLCLVSSRLVPVFFGNDFFGSILPMQILSFKMIAVMINSFFANNILMTFGLEKKFVVVVTTTAIVSFLLNLIFIPKFGAIGAAMINLSTESLEIILNLFFVYRLTKIRIKWKSMLQAFLSTLPFLLFYYIFTKIIENDTLFLICFISTSTLLYLFLQLSIFKNPLITQELDRLTRKKRILE